MVDGEGDPTYRAFPVDTARALLTITHDYYDHTAAERDLNVVLPAERVRELVAEGIVGSLTATCYSLMGHIDGRHVATLASRTAPEVAGRLMADGAEAVLLAPA
jgi:D-proline reductase (dithiol) PrdB